MEVSASPWMEPDEIEYLLGVLKPDMTCLEWGCGGSTLYFAPRVKQWNFIEHDQEWFSSVVDSVLEHGAEGHLPKVPRRRWNRPRGDNFKIARLVPKNWSHLSISKNEGCWLPYIEGWKSFRESKYDFILVDGRARPECVREVFDNKLLNEGGHLYLHDWWNVKSNRRYYNVVTEKYRAQLVGHRLVRLHPL